MLGLTLGLELGLVLGLYLGFVILGPKIRTSACPHFTKSANVGFSQVVQLFATPTKPANAENYFYKFGKKFSVLTMCAQILGFSRLRV